MTTINDLTAATAIAGTDKFIVRLTGETVDKSVVSSIMRTYMQSNLGSFAFISALAASNVTASDGGLTYVSGSDVQSQINSIDAELVNLNASGNLIEVSSDDAVPGFVESKIVEGNLMAMRTRRSGANEQRVVGLELSAVNSRNIFLYNNY